MRLIIDNGNQIGEATHMTETTTYTKGQEIKNGNGKSVVVVRPTEFGAIVKNGGEVWAGTWAMTFNQLQKWES